MNKVKEEKTSEIKKIGIIGDGRFAEAIAYLISKIHKDVEVVLWTYNEEERKEEDKKYFQHSKKYGKKMLLPEKVRITNNAEEVINRADVLFSMVPTQYMRKVFEREDIKGSIQKNWKNTQAIISGTKGFEIGTSKRPSEVLQDILDNDGVSIEDKLGVLSGRNFSKEILHDIPMGTNIVSENLAVQKIVIELLAQEGFDVFGKTDICKAEVFGALKNVLAIATGAAKGLRYEDERIKYLVEAGKIEINKFATALGADPETLSEEDCTMLDLVGTANSFMSRNYQTGYLYATQKEKGDTGVSEGVSTVKAVIPLAREKGITMPIAEAVYKIVQTEEDVAQIAKEVLPELIKVITAA